MCPKAFEYRSGVEYHTREIHNGIKPLKCNLCLKTFVQQCRLDSHTRTHIGDKPYICQSCNKTFSCLHLLNLHSRTHTWAKPDLCKLCHWSLPQSGSFRNHTKTSPRSSLKGIRI